MNSPNGTTYDIDFWTDINLFWVLKTLKSTEQSPYFGTKQKHSCIPLQAESLITLKNKSMSVHKSISYVVSFGKISNRIKREVMSGHF